MNHQDFFTRIQQTTVPLVAILRGITPAEARAVARLLVETGYRYLEVPLNSPQPFESIAIMAEEAGREACVGAGTVTTEEQVHKVVAAGGQLIVSPNADPAVIRLSAQLGLTSLPGVVTPSEAFAALQAGASGLKLFPAEMISPATVKALRAVLPPQAVLLPVGGIHADPDQMRQYLRCGAQGFGLGSGLYQPGISLATLHERATMYRDAIIAARS
ncbi:2-dehydro-3-deoxyphosphogalactonate aldolase [Silvimonas terrae]|uniref:2-dehydro-3-deoxyphosphogalactonate aldolase n=1 Tax=Silvimonas terrae TaxID=300266 RepID=A0A840RBR8_9NEIS|nr:2-dehydro-3-deoxy-6-phosphogalactonate aldolase [Silvimonas terrae]MBB5189876.1 2-dehydro-3-deoxyphosphogalactonate aldolase [Silvimonas terrae]